MGYGYTNWDRALCRAVRGVDGAAHRYLSRPLIVGGTSLVLSLVSAGAQALTNQATAGEPDDVDHAGFIQAWNSETLLRGENLYHTLCMPCHGTPQQQGTLPVSRAFWKEPFKNGNDPFSIYKTIGQGLGQMPAWPWLSAELRYDVIDYIRERLVRPNNPSNYFQITPAYLASLPKGSGRLAKKSAKLIEFEKGPKYLRMDFGPVLNWTYEVESNNIAYKGIAVRLDPGPGGISKGRAWMLYDHDTMRVASGWTGDQFVDWKGIAFDGSHQTHTSIVGDKAFINPVGPGWANPQTGSFADPRLRGRDNKPYGPLPREWIHFRGTYLNGGWAIIAYTVGDAEILERPGCESLGNNLAFSRTLNVGKSSHDLLLRICPTNSAAVLVKTNKAKIVQEGGFSVLHIRASATPVRLKVLIGHQAVSPGTTGLAALAAVSEPAADLRPLLAGGAPRWNREMITRGILGKPDSAFAVDTLPYPSDDQNPWQSWMRMGGFDFFRDGHRAAICTWNGDVWLVTGIEGDFKELKWRRIASGLFQPLGQKIVADTIYVTCRDQICRLHDLNGDGEIDFYQNFNNDHQVTEHFHEFALDLQTDREGNFYYAKGGRHALPAIVPQHGTLLKVSRDGLSTETIATGFRAPNGVCVNEDGTFLITDQEGHWTPKNRIDWVRPGRFYGYMWAYDHPQSSDDEAMEPSIVWITNDMDRSPAEIVRVPTNTWGPFQGSLLNISYGMGRIFLVPNEEVKGQRQGGVVQLPVPDFPTGVMRGRFHPGDGQLYVCGLVGWASNQEQDGGFFRVRYTGKPAYLPLELHARAKKMELVFSDALDATSANDRTNYHVRIWSLKRTQNYGSNHYDEHPLEVTGASLASDQRTALLSIPDLQPTWGMEIKCDLRGLDGTSFHRVIHNSIYSLAP
jgi:cytochrome c5